MKKQAAIIGSVLVAVCLFVMATPVYAAQRFPQKTASGASGDIKYYMTAEFRGLITREVSYVGNGSTFTSMTGIIIHVDLTFRNDSNKMAVGNDNNFTLTVNNLKYTPGTYELLYWNMQIENVTGTEIYDIGFNDASSNTTKSFTLNMHPTYTFVLEPQEKKDFAFDLFIPINTPNTFVQGATASAFNWDNVTCAWSQFPTFTMYTMTEYAREFEGFWPYLLRLIENFSIFNYEDPTIVQDVDNVEQGSNDNSDALGDAHTAEQGYFNQSSQDIADTGMLSFNFDQQQLSGISGVSGLFMRWWNALGPLSYVIIFGLMLRLAVMILRHHPTGGSSEDG